MRFAVLLSSLLAVTATAPALGSVSPPFHDSFDRTETLEETGKMSESASAHWWLNSGGRLDVADGVSTTIVGDLSASDPWRLLYADSNPVDTDDGFHPQNIFRLVTRGRWRQFRQEVSFRILATNLSASPERNAWSGILLFHRYQDGDNLYYAGLRADGAAVVKKKIGGSYFTLAYRKIYPGSYDRESKPNLLPQNRWVRLRTVIEDTESGAVRLRVEVLDAALGEGWIPLRFPSAVLLVNWVFVASPLPSTSLAGLSPLTSRPSAALSRASTLTTWLPVPKLTSTPSSPLRFA